MTMTMSHGGVAWRDLDGASLMMDTHTTVESFDAGVSSTVGLTRSTWSALKMSWRKTTFVAFEACAYGLYCGFAGPDLWSILVVGTARWCHWILPVGHHCELRAYDHDGMTTPIVNLVGMVTTTIGEMEKVFNKIETTTIWYVIVLVAVLHMLIGLILFLK